MPLPTDIDATYGDSGTDPTVALHQQYHDLLHGLYNDLEGKEVLHAQGGQTIEVASASTTPLTLKGAAAQTANLQEWQDSAGTVLARVTAGGTIIAPILLAGTSPASGILRAGITTATDKGLVVRGAASQTANLAEWQNSAGAVLSRIGPGGALITRQASILSDSDTATLVVQPMAGQTQPVVLFNNSDGAQAARINADGSTTLKKTVRIPHTWHIPGEVKVASGDTDFILPGFFPVPAGAISATVAVVYTRLNSGTSVTWNLARTTYAGTTTNLATGLFAAGGSNAGDSIAGGALSTGNPDRLAPVVTAVSGTPKNMAITVAVDYTF